MSQIIGTTASITEMDIFGDGTMETSYVGEVEKNTFTIDDDTIVKIGDFEVTGKILGKILEKFTKENMPQALI